MQRPNRIVIRAIKSDVAMVINIYMQTQLGVLGDLTLEYNSFNFSNSASNFCTYSSLLSDTNLSLISFFLSIVDWIYSSSTCYVFILSNNLYPSNWIACITMIISIILNWLQMFRYFDLFSSSNLIPIQSYYISTVSLLPVSWSASQICRS